MYSVYQYNGYEIAIQLVAALLLDKLLGEPTRWHPLAGFGSLAKRLESHLNQERFNRRFMGFLACVILLLPIPSILLGLIIFTSSYHWVVVINVLALYICIGRQSLLQHSMNIYTPLTNNNIQGARVHASRIVSRDTGDMTPESIVRSNVESILENGNDAVMASIFYFLVGGAPAVILHRLVNTLDAMWGYKSPRYRHFGYCAAKFDDFLAFPSACVTAVFYCLQSRPFTQCWKNFKLAWIQSKRYKSRNAGLVMASGAGSMSIKLGGVSHYNGIAVQSPVLGRGVLPGPGHILCSNKMVLKAAYMMVMFCVLVQLLKDVV